MVEDRPTGPCPVAVLGAGSIGVSWSVVFARGGHPVALLDPDAARRRAAVSEVAARLGELEASGILDEPAQVAADRVAVAPELAEAVAEAGHVQECVPEDLTLKRELFARVEGLAAEDAVLASSSSALLPSVIFAGLGRPERALVAHPANPPHLLPVVELVGSHETAPLVIDATARLLERCGMSPVRVRREVEGFVYNRLQGAVLREAYCLVRDGVVDVDDLDRVVRDGLGRRWAVVGPFETVDLNTRGGIAAHATLMGPAYARMGAERGQDDPWTDDLVAEVSAQRRRLLPLEAWDDRVRWRDTALLRHERARRTAEAPRADRTGTA